MPLEAAMLCWTRAKRGLFKSLLTESRGKDISAHKSKQSEAKCLLRDKMVRENQACSKIRNKAVSYSVTVQAARLAIKHLTRR